MPWLTAAIALVQTSIQAEGFRSLAEGEPVEYFLESGDDGRTKAVQVTGPNGAPPQVSCAADAAALRPPLLKGLSVPLMQANLKLVAVISSCTHDLLPFQC